MSLGYLPNERHIKNLSVSLIIIKTTSIAWACCKISRNLSLKLLRRGMSNSVAGRQAESGLCWLHGTNPSIKLLACTHVCDSCCYRFWRSNVQPGPECLEGRTASRIDRSVFLQAAGPKLSVQVSKDSDDSRLYFFSWLFHQSQHYP